MLCRLVISLLLLSRVGQRTVRRQNPALIVKMTGSLTFYSFRISVESGQRMKMTVPQRLILQNVYIT